MPTLLTNVSAIVILLLQSTRSLSFSFYSHTYSFSLLKMLPLSVSPHPLHIGCPWDTSFLPRGTHFPSVGKHLHHPTFARHILTFSYSEMSLHPLFFFTGQFHPFLESLLPYKRHSSSAHTFPPAVQTSHTLACSLLTRTSHHSSTKSRDNYRLLPSHRPALHYQEYMS